MQQNIAEILQARRYDQNIVPPAEQVIYTIDGKTIGTLQNYVIHSGLPKAGKGIFGAAAISTCFMPGDMYGIKLQMPEGRRRVALFDTELSDYDFHRQMTRIKNFAGINGLPDFFDAFKCREDGGHTIKQMVETYLVQHPDCSILFIDGILDLLTDFNDVAESRALVDWFKRITKIYNLLLIGVLHLGKKDGHTLGHLGSMVDRYCQSLLKVEKDKENKCYTLSAELLRSAADDITPISLQNVGGGFQQTHAERKEKKPLAKVVELPLDEHRQRLHNIFTWKKEMDYKTLVQQVQEEYGTGTNKAKDLVRELKQKNLIRKNQNELYEKTA